MNFNLAKNFVIPFGDYKGKTIDEAASTSEGLIYLDNTMGWMEDKGYKGRYRTALGAYLSDETIQRELDAARD